MEEVGVQAVVKGLSAFIGDIGKMNSSLKSIEPSGGIVTRTLEGMSSAFSGLIGFMGRVAEVALGVLVRDAFNAIVSGLKEIISSTIEAGNEFQILGLRLGRLNFNTAISQIGDYTAATTQAEKATKDQLSWVQQLAATTPYDFQDIANVFTLARSYGFADDAAKGLTQDISDFAAGMGLGNTEIERIIINMGQMVQQGKVTQRELNDLARGAFVPVNDIITQMQKNVGKTGKEFDKFKTTGEGVNAFMTAFSQIVGQRFTGASEAMARTFKGSTDNVKDFIKSIFGFGVVTPILDKVGGKIADVLEGLTSPGTFAAISLSVQRFGEAVSDLIGDLLGLGDVDTAGISQRILQGFNRATTWIEDHKDDIISFFTNVKDTVKELIDAVKTGDFEGFLAALGVPQETIDKIISFRDTITGTLDTIKAWIDENKPTIDEFFSTLGEIVSTVIENLTGKEIDTEGGLQSLLDGIVNFMTYVIENKDKIADFATKLVELWGILQIVGFILSIILPPVIGLVAGFAGLIATVAGVISIISLFLSPIGLVVILIGLVIAAVWLLIDTWPLIVSYAQLYWNTLVNVIKHFVNKIVDGIVEFFGKFLEIVRSNWETINTSFSENIQSVKDFFTPSKWLSVGKDMMQGLWDGIKSLADSILGTLADLADDAIEIVNTIFGNNSPSKVFKEIGQYLMEGLAIGIEDSQGMAIKAMQNAAAAVAMPAMYATAEMGGMVSTQNNYAYNYNLTVNSSAPSEPIVQDYNMLQSLAGA